MEQGRLERLQKLRITDPAGARPDIVLSTACPLLSLGLYLTSEAPASPRSREKVEGISHTVMHW